MLLHSNAELIYSFRIFIEKHRRIIIFSPYIKLEALKELVTDFESHIVTIITTWKPMDIAIGVTDIEIYNYCIENNIQLLINNNIHLKCLLDYDYTTCTVSSSNITHNGLALSKLYNYELGTIVRNLTLADKCYFDSIFDTSILVTKVYYESLIEQIKKLSPKIKEIPKDFDFNKNLSSHFLTSQLPYYDQPENLYNVVVDQKNYTDDEIRSAFHDIRLYNITNSTDMNDFKYRLKSKFLKNEFIKCFLEFNEDGKYFGELTSWLHSKIENVPSPKRFEVKEYQQRIYSYIDYLLKDKYLIHIPKNHSQFLKRL